MRIECLYSQGSAPYREDGLVATRNLFGVLDGVSAPYAPKYPIKKFNGMSGGEMVSRLCERICHIQPDMNLQLLIHLLNEAVGNEQQFGGVSRDDAGELAGATFAFAQIEEQMITVLQTGDCLAVIEIKSGELVVTPNQVRHHDEQMTAQIEYIQRQVAQDLFGMLPEKVPEDKRGKVRDEMLNRFYETLQSARREAVNKPGRQQGYGLLNGQPELQYFLWEKSFWHNGVSTIILLSDGIVPWTIMRSAHDEAIGHIVFNEFRNNGLAGLLLRARGIEAQNADTAYLDHAAEATAVAIQF